MSKLATTLMNEVPAKQIDMPTTTSIMKQQSSIKTKQQLLAKEVFSFKYKSFKENE